MSLNNILKEVREQSRSRVLFFLSMYCLFLVLLGCAQQTGSGRLRSNSKEYFPESVYGPASPRLVADGEPVPKGGGQYLVGRPYKVAGRTYVPSEIRGSFTQTGTASWYGDAFHGRRTANGEIYDKRAITAAHPTMPLPSYVRVTNMRNGYSMIVRVNDRGPYHSGRVMDVSARVAEALDFKRSGTGQVRVEYMGRADLSGAQDEKLYATLRTDGLPASLERESNAQPVMVADQSGVVGISSTLPPSMNQQNTTRVATLPPDSQNFILPTPKPRPDKNPKEAPPEVKAAVVSSRMSSKKSPVETPTTDILGMPPLPPLRQK